MVLVCVTPPFIILTSGLLTVRTLFNRRRLTKILAVDSLSSSIQWGSMHPLPCENTKVFVTVANVQSKEPSSTPCVTRVWPVSLFSCDRSGSGQSLAQWPSFKQLKHFTSCIGVLALAGYTKVYKRCDDPRPKLPLLLPGSPLPPFPLPPFPLLVSLQSWLLRDPLRVEYLFSAFRVSLLLVGYKLLPRV